MTIHEDPDLATALPIEPGQRSTVQYGESIDEYAGYGDYFGFDERDRWYFPDGKQWIEFKKLNEGERARFLKATKSDVLLNQKTNEARIGFDQSNDRKQLLLHACTDWHVVRRDNGKVIPMPFANNSTPGCAFGMWIDKANPAILAQLEKKIRMSNTWLMSEMTSEQIKLEIADLQELLAAAEKREAEEKNS